MHDFLRKHRLLGGLILILATGFLATGGAAYMAFQDAVREGASARPQSLAADSAYADIQKHFLPPIAVASQMAGDASVRNWILEGEKDPDQITRYLNEIRQKHGASSTFLVSERSRRHYRGHGTPKAVPAGDAGEGWFFRVRSLKEAYETSADTELAEGNPQALSVSHRILDSQGNFIGIAGISFDLAPVIHLIESHESRCRCSIHLIDGNGIILNGNSSMQHLRDHPGLRQVAADLLTGSAEPVQASIRLGNATARVSSRLIPEAGWRLVVVGQSDQGDLQPVRQAVFPTIAVGAAATALALLLFVVTAGLYQRRLGGKPGIDPVTGLMNREAYEFVFQQTLLEVNRGGQPLSLVMLEVDSPGPISTRLGRRASNRVMQGLAQLAQKAVRTSDPVSRWDGQQLLIQLRDCPCHEAIAVAERLRISIASHNFGLKDSSRVVTISLGVAQYQPQEPGSAFLQRVKDALHVAKAKGRNRVEPEVPGEQAE